MRSNSVAIVTGAGQGIGRATVLRLVRDFSAIVLVLRNEEELQKASFDVKPAGPEALVVSPAAKWMTGASARMDGGEIKGI